VRTWTSPLRLAFVILVPLMILGWIARRMFDTGSTLRV
jgi:hypothetical protein